jgi:hypothetical protein
MSVSVPCGWFTTPPPLTPVATPGGELAVLSVIRVFATVRSPELSIPAPNANAHDRFPQNPGGISVCEFTVLPVMTLSVIVTLAPVVLPSAAGIQTPPPDTTDVSGCELLTPPVSVTPLSVTVGRVVPKNSPI